MCDLRTIAWNTIVRTKIVQEDCLRQGKSSTEHCQTDERGRLFLLLEPPVRAALFPKAPVVRPVPASGSSSLTAVVAQIAVFDLPAADIALGLPPESGERADSSGFQ